MSHSLQHLNIKKAIYRILRRDIGTYLIKLCDYKGVEIVEATARFDHIYMLVKISPNMKNNTM